LDSLVEVRDSVEAEAVEADVEPEAHHVEHHLLDLFVVIVEVGLVAEEAMPVVLLALGVPRPVRALGVDEDHAGVGPLLVVVTPHVPVGVGVGAVGARHLEPRVLIAGVVHDQVGDDSQAAGVGLLDEGHGVAEVAVLGEHREEVADVVPAAGVVEASHQHLVEHRPLVPAVVALDARR
jgi:hypothetical protein